jgi:hypothetical protein
MAVIPVPRHPLTCSLEGPGGRALALYRLAVAVGAVAGAVGGAVGGRNRVQDRRGRLWFPNR